MASVPGLAETRKQVTFELEPELRPIADRALAMLELAAKKAVAHDASPKKYPMPAGKNELEHILYQRLRQRPVATRKRSAAQVMPTLRPGPSAALAGLGTSTVDLTSTRPVAAQVGTPAPKAGFKPEAILASVGQVMAAVPTRAIITPYTGVELRIHKVVCRSETNEWGSDEFDLAGISIDATGDTRPIPRFRVSSDFDSGEQVKYSPQPKLFARFPFASDNTITVNGKTKTVGWPRTYHVTFLPAEIDNGGFPEFANKLYQKARDQVTKWVAEAVAAYTGGAAGAIIGVAVGKIVGYAMDRLFDLLVRWWEDDMFIPLTSTAKLTGASADFKGKVGGTATTSPRMLWWKQHGGHYEVHYDWRLYRA
jgi:hypothetical protein